jgi:hypothetical protein
MSAAPANPVPFAAPDSRRTFFILLCALVFFFTGGHVVQSFVNYPTWRFIDAGSFPAFHESMAIRAAFFLMLPRVLEVVMAGLLLWRRPQAVPRNAMALAFGLAVVAFLITVTMARPTHIQLGAVGNTPELLARLRYVDLSRLGLEIVRAAIYLWLLLRVVHLPR